MGVPIAAGIALLLALRLAGCGFHGDPASVLDSAPRRLWEIGSRRGSVLGVTLLAWAAALAAALLATRARAARPAARLAALSLAYLPLACLAGAALEPGVGAERLLLALGAPALALLTLAALGGYRALAVACAATVLAYTADAIAGSPLTQLSLVGPNPAAGHRFYGIGNELEAILVVLVLAGTGAALTGFTRWERGQSGKRRSAEAFVVVAAVLTFAFAYGGYGADVGAAISLPLGAAVAAALVAGQRRLALLAFLLPLPAVALLAAADLVTGAHSHLTSTVLQTGNGGDALAVIGHRLGETGQSFGRTVLLPGLPVAIAAALLAWTRRDRLATWTVDRPALRAGLLGALAATLAGTLANDSGALLLEIGALYLAAFVAFAWADAGPGLRHPSTQTKSYTSASHM
jgi:hypothetical protein